MKVKRFVVSSMQAGLKQAAEALGPEAVILSTRKLAEGTEIVAGVDEAELARFEASKPPPPDPNAIIKANPEGAGQGQPDLDPESLKGLLQRLAPKNRAAFGDAAPDAEASKPRPKAAPTSQETTRPTATPAGIDHSAQRELMSAMRQEIDGLRQLLQQQTDFLRAPAPVASPQLEKLEGRFQALGLGESVQRSLLRHYDRDATLDTNWRRLLARLAAGLSVPVFDPLTEGGVIALCGPTGAGKTTTLAKMAARYVKRHGYRQVAIVSTDYYQLGAQDTLASVAQILGVEFVALEEGESLTATLEDLAGYRLVLVDTSGSGEALAQWRSQVVESGLEQRLQSVLVVPATAHADSLNRFLEAFPGRHLAGAIITKLDEAPCFGSIFDSLLRHRWPLWYNTAGQRIPQDIDSCDPVRLVKRLARGLTDSRTGLAEAS